MRLVHLWRGTYFLIVAAGAALSPAMAQSPMLGQAYPSGAIYLMAPEGDDLFWPDAVSLMPLSQNGQSVTARLDRIARDVHPPFAENAPSAAGRCGRGGDPVAQQALDIFDPGMPDNCEGDDQLGLYRAQDGISPAAVLGWTGAFDGPPDLSTAGQPRVTSAAEEVEADAYRDAFRAQYQSAFDTPYDPDLSPIGEIPTLADALILAEIPITGGTLRLSEWERISISQHIYRHFIVDVIRDESIVETFQFIRFQGVLG